MIAALAVILGALDLAFLPHTMFNVVCALSGVVIGTALLVVDRER